MAFTTVEFGKIVKDILVQNGFSEESLADVGSHSLKTTCLSWASKFGMNKDHRRHLGYHVRPGDRSMDLYGRDTMAAPLRALVEVIDAIKTKRFHPDSTRSGTFAASSSQVPADPGMEEEVIQTSSSTSPAATDEEQAPMCVRNMATGMLHMTGLEGIYGKMSCGKVLPLDFVLSDALPVSGPRCPRCFTAERRV